MYDGRKTLKSMSDHIADDLMSSGYFDDNEQLPVLFVGRPKMCIRDRQITYKLYSEQEIAEDSSRNNVEFYYYPASTPDAKYALVLSCNIFNRTAELKECISTAYQLHQKGYAVFVMRYRAYPDNDNNGPMEDIARAVKYIIGHAQQFGVQTESYALIGYSSCLLYTS